MKKGALCVPGSSRESKAPMRLGITCHSRDRNDSPGSIHHEPISGVRECARCGEAGDPSLPDFHIPVDDKVLALRSDAKSRPLRFYQHLLLSL
jgi:hypothetical protein